MSFELVAVVHIVWIASTQPASCQARACVNWYSSTLWPRGQLCWICLITLITFSEVQKSFICLSSRVPYVVYVWAICVGKLLTINYYQLNGEGNGIGAALGTVLQRRVKAGDWGVEASLWWLGWWWQWYWRHHWCHHQGFAAQKDGRTVNWDQASHNNVHV